MTCQILLADQLLQLLPQRAAYWPAQQALLLADVHLGKDQVFRRAGMAVPAGMLAHDLARIDGLLDSTGAQRLIVLGDWVHAPPRPDDEWPDQIRRWRDRRPALSIDLVLGNHDRALAAALADWGITAHQPVLDLAGLRLVHDWTDAPGQAGISGHLHPGAVIGQRRERVRLPAFLLGAGQLVLPAFGRFTGLMIHTGFPTEHCGVIAGEKVLSVPPPRRRIRD